MRLILLLLFVLLSATAASAKDRFLTTSLGQNKLVTSADNVEVLANSASAVAVNDAVYISGAGTVAKASATTTAQPVLGIVIELVSTTQCRVLTRGLVDAYSTGMTTGTAYYLSETAGALQTTPVLASGKLAQYVGVAASSTALLVEPQNMSLSGTSGGQLVTATYDGKLPAMDGSNLTNLPPGGDGIAGATGSTDNAVLRADGTGGGTAQASALICDDSGNLSGINNITLSGTVDGVDVSGLSSVYQPLDATLTGVAAWAWSSGTEVRTLTAADTFGTLNVGTAANNLVQLDGSSKLPAVDGSQLINVASGMGTGRTFYYNYTDASDIGGGYKIAQTTPSANAQSALSQGNTGTSFTLVATFATAIGQPSVTSLPAGISDRTFWASVSNGVAQLRLETYKRTHPGGTETLLRTSTSQTFTNTEAAAITWATADPSSHAMGLTDRLVYKLYTARVSGPATVTVDLFFEGTTRFSHSHSTIAEPTPALTALTTVGPPTAADQFLYSTAATTWSLGTVTAAGRALMDDATASDQRTTLGLGTAATEASTAFQAADATLTAVAAWSWTSGVEVKTLTAADTFGTLRIGTSASNLVQLDSSALVPRANVAYSSVAENVQVFTQTGANTWTPPANYTSVTIILVGGGGSGGSGYKGASGSGRPGGCGGGGGGTTILTFPASTVGSGNVTVTVGAGNTSPGAARTSDGSPGLAGAAGGETTFGTFARAGGGGGGTGGVISGTFAGGVGGTGTIPGGTGATSSATATVDATATLFGGTAGGGAGGGITTGNVDIVGGAGATGSTFISATGLAGGAGGTTGSHAGGSATDSSTSTGTAYGATCGGGGGGGYGSNASSAGGTGAAGGLYGGGGGGGGAGKNATTNSGAGGNGANGIAIVISRF
jgi:hypothetical protein